MNAEEYCQAPGPAEKAFEVSMPNLSSFKPKRPE